MKKILTFAGCVCVAVMLQSCYSSSVYVGKLHPQEEVTCVGTSHNAHFFGGLIGSKKIRAKNYVDNLHKNYSILFSFFPFFVFCLINCFLYYNYIIEEVLIQFF